MAEENTIEVVSKENFIKDGKIYILGAFDKSISQNIIPGLSEIINNSLSEKNPSIIIYINSFGGYAHELMGFLALLDIAKQLKIPIITHVLGCAYSCASILAMYGDSRLMSSRAKHLIHLGSSISEVSTLTQLEREYLNTKEWFDTIIQLYVEHTKMSKEEVKKLLSDDKCFLNAKQCKKFGLCDEII